METELRDTTEKLRKTMEQSSRQQSDYMSTKEQLSSLEKSKVGNTLLHTQCSKHGKTFYYHNMHLDLLFCFSVPLVAN